MILHTQNLQAFETSRHERQHGAEMNHSIGGHPIPTDCRCMTEPNPNPPSLLQIRCTAQLTHRFGVVLYGTNLGGGLLHGMMVTFLC